MMKASRSMDWSSPKQNTYNMEKKPSITCFNARIDFLNNLSEGIVKKLPKQRRNSRTRERDLDMPLPPGCFPEKVTLALSQSSSNLLSPSLSCKIDMTNSDTMETLSPRPSGEKSTDLENRVDSWYVHLTKTDTENEPPKPKGLIPSHINRQQNPKLEVFKRQSNFGASLKLQNGSYPLRYSHRKKSVEKEGTKESKAQNKQDENNNSNNNNNNNIQQNDIQQNDETNEISFTESIDESSGNTGTLSSDTFDPLSDKIEDPFSRSSSALSKSPSLRSELNSVFSMDSTYGTSEFSSHNGSSVIPNSSSYDFQRLTNVLEHIDGEVLKEHLKTCLESRNSRLTKALSSLLPRSKFSGNTTHCTRCHEDYDRHHGNMTCILRHPNEEVVLISEDGKSALFQCERCVCVFKLDGTIEYDENTTDIVSCGACFIGHHTDNACDVDYEHEGYATPCSELGCSIFYV